ncbi:MAG: beta-ketoacyl synthase N-terminal-like domain-containing protein [Armatimonadota bacterium]
MRSVVITGIGPVSAIGIGRDAWLAGLAGGESGVSPLSLFAADHPTAEVRHFDLDTLLPSVKTYLDRASAFTLAAGQLALADAGLTEITDRWRAGVVLGSEFGCLNTMQIYTAALQQKGARLANPLLFSHMYVNTPTSLAAIEFGLGGHHGTFAGDGAGRQALESAVEALQLGRAELILAVGVDAISEPLYCALVAEEALGDMPLGEGACALVLETAECAASRGAAGLPLDNIDVDASRIRAQLGETFAAEPFFAIASDLVTAKH